MLFRIFDASFISTIKVDSPTEILSDVELKEMSNEALTKCHNAGLSDSEISNLRQIKNKIRKCKEK